MEERIVINGRSRVGGEIAVHGAKNSPLPILAATILVYGVSVIHNCPNLTDVDAAIKILECLGCTVKREGSTVIVDSRQVDRDEIPDNLMREMRSSIVFLGSIAARMKRVELSTPGGCEIGLRPIDLHLSSMKQLGMTVTEEYGKLVCSCENGIQGAKIALSFPSVGATENIMLAACMAEGHTTIINPAREPEISDLADFLNRAGARVHGAGDSIIEIEGVAKLRGAEHHVIPDRIIATTYMAAAAATYGSLRVTNIIPAHLMPIIPIFEQMGCDVNVRCGELSLSAPPRLKSVKQIRTMPYPGFPTDAQAPIMAVTAIAEGTSMFVENIFESRYKHTPELMRMGAKVTVNDRVAVVEGVQPLYGANVIAPDLRGGAALVVAGLAAQGTTTISEIGHIDRGYEDIAESLSGIGADIKRLKADEQSEE
ncbi:MAG: UDP-N-acetylglucosamine 1-carboxyvinyltransferase [Clostridiales bacterium]|nr:UDP-N-acetylglucosamine 1-carboxyvinyltransferase [Clostridiales bacterium]